jgi:hypothetical protein
VKKQFEDPTIGSYDQEELAPEAVFTSQPSV